MGIYDERPWLKLYAPGKPHDIEIEYDTMLAAFTETVRAVRRRASLPSSGRGRGGA